MRYHMTTWKTLLCDFLFFFSQPSPDRRRKNSRQWLGSCWSLSTLCVSAHKCNYFSRMPRWPDIYRLCSIYQASRVKGACTPTCTPLICTHGDLIPLGWRGQLIYNESCPSVWSRTHINFSPDLIWVWMGSAVINRQFQLRDDSLLMSVKFLWAGRTQEAILKRPQAIIFSTVEYYKQAH